MVPWAGDWLLGVEKPRRAGPDEASPPGRDEEPDIAERMAEDYVVVDIGLCSQTGMKRHREKTRRENAQWVVFNNTIASVFVEYLLNVLWSDIDRSA